MGVWEEGQTHPNVTRAKNRHYGSLAFQETADDFRRKYLVSLGKLDFFFAKTAKKERNYGTLSGAEIYQFVKKVFNL